MSDEIIYCPVCNSDDVTQQNGKCECDCCGHEWYANDEHISEDMSYNKCYNCPHSRLSYYSFDSGAVLTCKITNRSITIDGCVKDNKVEE